MPTEKRFPEGIYFSQPRDGAPTYVLGSISVKSDMFLDWLHGEQPNDRGYVNLDVLMSKEGKPYVVVNDYKPKVKQSEPAKGDDGEEVPF